MADHNDPIQNSLDPIPQAPYSDDHSASHHQDSEIDDRDHFDHELGFSLSELLIVIAIVGILMVVVIGEFQNAIHKARLSACLANMVTIREEVWSNCDGGLDFPDRDRLWNEIFRGHGPRGFWYEIDNDDPNKGHGNDLDGFDEQNPGKAPRTDRNIYFVVACEHDHNRLADFVYLEDEGSPQISMPGDKPPIWFKFYRKDHN
jgi:prepilin-type N-terminal cleavage/methylation domain-containing protein